MAGLILSIHLFKGIFCRIFLNLGMFRILAEPDKMQMSIRKNYKLIIM
jgi:hypothetical protein